MACVNQTRAPCVNQVGKTQSKSLAARYGMGTAWYMLIGLKKVFLENLAVTWLDINSSASLESQKFIANLKESCLVVGFTFEKCKIQTVVH
jgi:hypothetical protein